MSAEVICRKLELSRITLYKWNTCTAHLCVPNEAPEGNRVKEPEADAYVCGPTLDSRLQKDVITYSGKLD